MAEEEQEPKPIIIKKVKKHHGVHGGAWKVAYADFVTSMMALFIVLWIMGQSAEVKEAVASYFKDPIGFSNKGRQFLEGKYNNPDLRSQKEIKAKETKKFKQISSQLMNELKRNPEFNKLLNQVEVKIVREGLRIELVDSDRQLFFKIGTANLNKKAERLLEKIGGKLASLQNNIIVEGHTDSRPYSGNGYGYSNFELSTERANSARRALMKGGLPEDHFEEVRGYADRYLKDKKDPFNAINRRISILIKYTNIDSIKTKPYSDVYKIQ